MFPLRALSATPNRFRFGHDTVDQFGKLALRNGSRLHHSGIGRAHSRTPVLILVTTQTATITIIGETATYSSAANHDPDRIVTMI